MKKKIILISSIAFFLITCRNDKGQLPIPMVTTASDCDSAWFTGGKIGPIINASCNINSGCHGAGGSASVLYTSYAAVKGDVDNGTLKNRLFDVKDMPKAPGTPLSALQLKQIDCWLTNGAPNTGTGTVCTSCCTTISCSGTIAPLIGTNCATSGCHSGATGVQYGDYTTYSGLQTDANNGKLNTIVVLKTGPTFPYSHPPLSATDISNIDCWIKQGALNN